MPLTPEKRKDHWENDLALGDGTCDVCGFKRVTATFPAAVRCLDCFLEFGIDLVARAITEQTIESDFLSRQKPHSSPRSSDQAYQQRDDIFRQIFNS